MLLTFNSNNVGLYKNVLHMCGVGDETSFLIKWKYRILTFRYRLSDISNSWWEASAPRLQRRSVTISRTRKIIINIPRQTLKSYVLKESNLILMLWVTNNEPLALGADPRTLGLSQWWESFFIFDIGPTGNRTRFLCATQTLNHRRGLI